MSEDVAPFVAPALPPGSGRATPAIVPAHIEGASFGDRVYRLATTGFALVIPALLLLIAWEVFHAGWPALTRFGFGFFTSSDWDAVKGNFGAAPAIYGTARVGVQIAEPTESWLRLFVSWVADEQPTSGDPEAPSE